MRRTTPCLAVWLAAATCLSPLVGTAFAQTAPAAAPTPAPAPVATPAADAAPPGFWINGIHLGAQIEGGFTANPATPDSGTNFGHLFDDRANQPLLNQFVLTANKPLDPKATGFDWGFKLQGMYGSDARYTHFLGIFDQNPGPGYRNQFDITEANVLLHMPYLTEGGIDIKAGLYTTPLGYETIDPSTNPFYSHSYIFNFGLPLKHTGILSTTHVNSLLDVYLGIDTGVNTTFGPSGDNNGAIAGIAGFGLNMMDGKLTLLALSHFGPENPSRALAPLGFNANAYMRYLNDVVVTYKATDKLTLVTEANWIRDDFLGFNQTGKPGPADAYGIAQYLSYTLSEVATFNARVEVYRDANNVFVASFTGNNDFVRGELGLPFLSPVLTASSATTYGALTLGVTFKPNLPAPITGLLIRPEFRYDTSLNGTKPFKDGTNTGQLTLAADFVLTF